jgi:hypothetical protein
MKNKEKFIVKQDNPHIYDVWGILYGLDESNLKNLYLNEGTGFCLLFRCERRANQFVKAKCQKEIDGKPIYYRVLRLRAFIAELLPVEVKANDK